MALVPVREKDQIELLSVPEGVDAAQLDEYRAEEVRRRGILRRREYVDGRQYDVRNAEKAQTCELDAGGRLPEHERLHAYSTQTEDSVGFVANQLAHGFALEAKDGAVQQVVEDLVDATPILSPGSGDGIVCYDILVDALTAGDVPYEVKWDPVDGTAFLELWESEHVHFVLEPGNRVREVIRDEMVWRKDRFDNPQLSRERVIYDLAENGFGQSEARRRTFYDEEDTPTGPTVWLGYPFVPWGLLRGVKKGLREFRGTSLITDRIMRHADRYDAVEHRAYLIVRYNSHGNLVVVGDGAQLQVDKAGGVQKDVADALTFPGGTGWGALTLPTNPEMIEHQRRVLAEAIYQGFGLTRIEPDTLEGLGQLSGYALEILNRKSDGTFSAVANQFSKDVRELVNLVLDVTAYKAGEPTVAVLDPAEGDDRETVDEDVDPESSGVPAVDPMVVYPRRDLDIRLGNGYIVDNVEGRDDFTAKLTSRRYTLQQRGLSDPAIDDIEADLAEESQSGTEGTATNQPDETGAGLQLVDGEGEPTGTETPGAGADLITSTERA